jgi:uncharacterized membrane protein YfcA
MLEVAIVLVVFAGALTRATFGFGEAVVSMPLLALLPLGLPTAASLIGLAGLTVAVFSLGSGVRAMDRGAFFRLCVSTVLGIPLGIVLLRTVPPATAATVLGVLLVLYGVYALIPAAPTGTVSPLWAYPTGALAGALGSAYNLNGMPVVVFGTLRGWAPPVFRGTLQAHFLFSGVLVVAGQALGGLWTAELPRLFALSLPAIGVATLAGHRLHARIRPHQFERAVYILVAVLGAVLTIRGLWSR